MNRNEARYGQKNKKKNSISHKFLLINLRSPLPLEKKAQSHFFLLFQAAFICLVVK